MTSLRDSQALPSRKQTWTLAIVACAIALGIGATRSAGTGDGNWPVCCSATSGGFDLNVVRSGPTSASIPNSRELDFMWRVRSGARYDAFNVRVKISDGREGQAEVSGRTYVYAEHNAGWGLTYTFSVQGCNKGTFSSSCTPWGAIVFKNRRGSNGHVDGIFARNP